MVTFSKATPYLFYQTAHHAPFVSHGEGIYIYDQDGNRYIDGCSGAMICNIGHGDKRVIEAMQHQAEFISYTYRTQFENEPAHLLATRLVENSAPHLNRVFYVSGGSEAVESCLKLARQYFYVQGEGRNIFISRRPSYHGATMGALSVTSYAPLKNPYLPMLRPQPKIPAPYCYRCYYGLTYPECELRCADALEETIQTQGEMNVAGFLVEPVGGASVGALPPPPGYFDRITDICDRYGLLLILDEVMTGFGRTGKLFAYEHWDLKGDIVALSKGMASGYYPMGGMLSRSTIVDTILQKGSFPHGHTYAGSPMACAVSKTVLDIILEDGLVDNAAAMGKVLGKGLKALEDKHDIVGQARGIGLLWALEIVRDKETTDPFPADRHAAETLTRICFDLGLNIYPRHCINGVEGDHVLVAPPLIVNEEQIGDILKILDEGLTRLAQALGS